MAAATDGKVSAERGRTAILVAAAAAAALQPRGKHGAFAREHGFKLGRGGISRALALRRRPADPDDAPTDPDEREWVWNSLGVDTAKLGLDLVVAWIPRPTEAKRRAGQAKLLESLRNTPGVVEIHDCFDDSVLVHALAPDPPSKRRLQSRLEELCPDVLWAEVRQADPNQPARGWLHVARVIAAAENRLEGD